MSWKIVQIDVILRPRHRPTDHRTPVMLSLGLGLKTKFFGLGLGLGLEPCGLVNNVIPVNS